MTSFLAVLDRAAFTLHEGFESTAIWWWRGAVILYLVMGSLAPFASFGNTLWLGVLVMASAEPADVAMSAAAFYWMGACLMAVGVAGMLYDLRAMAQGKINGRRIKVPDDD
jgi:hypothetical protein